MTPPSPDRWTRVEDIFTTARGLPEGERNRYLATACGEDDELREELASLLERAPTAEAFFAALDARHFLLEEEPGVLASPMDRIGPYELLEELGRGGMGIVFSARDTRLGRLVAVKLLPHWLSGDPAAKERLAAEARSASAIDHPNIATLHDVVEMPDGALALVMAHYEGETLRSRLARGPLPAEEAVEIARQVASGLLAAHLHGIVHRDIKPGNLLLTSGGLVKILDFGIAKALDADVTSTSTGPARGTTSYMSPEQVRGDAVDHRSDLWSLGVVLYEIVTGERPFRGEGQAAVMRAILEDEPVSTGPAGPTGTTGLDSVLAKLLAKRPADRFASAAALLSGLGSARTAAEEPASVVARPGRSLSRVRWVHTPRVAIPSALAIVLLSLLVVWGLRRTNPPSSAPESANRVAVLPFVVRGSPEFAYLGEAIVDLLSSGMDGAEDLLTVEPRAMLDEARGRDLSVPGEAAELAALFEAPRYVLGEIVEADGSLRIRAALYDRAGGPEPVAQAIVEGPVERTFNLVDEIAAQLLLGIHGEPVEPAGLVAQRTTASLPALKAYLTGRTALREGRFGEAVVHLRRAIAQDSLFALAYYDLSQAAAWGRQFELSAQAGARANELSGRLPERERLLVQAYHTYISGETARAESLYRQVLAAYPNTADGWQGLAELLFHYNPLRGRSKFGAKAYFERAIGFDPQYGEAIFHLMQIAAWEGDRSGFETLQARLRSDQPVWSALGALAWGTAEEESAALKALSRAGDHDVLHALETVEFTDDLVAMTRVARLLDDPSRPDEWRALGRHALAEIEMGRGRGGAALEESDRIAEFDPAWARFSRGLLVTTPLATLSAEDVRRARADLEAWDPLQSSPSINDPFGVHDPYRPQIRLYLLGLLDLQLGEVDRALGRARALEGIAGSGSPEPNRGREIALALASGVRARVLRAHGDPAAALEALEERRLRLVDDEIWSPILAQPGERWLRAELLLETGRVEEALDWYRSVDEFFPGFRTRAPAVLRMAQVHERLGDRAAAAREYRRFVRHWGEADPELRSHVHLARERLAALR